MNISHNNNRNNLGFTQDIHATALIASLFYMMTCYSRKKDSSLIEPILEGLEYLSGHPDVVNPQLKEILSKLKGSWETISEADLIDFPSASLH